MPSEDVSCPAQNSIVHRLNAVLALCCVLFSLLALAVWASALSQSGTARLEPLDQKINPNTAPLASLMRLPGIGPSRAQAIVAYRQQQQLDPACLPFSSCQDLAKVKGIGPKTVQALAPCLRFD